MDRVMTRAVLFGHLLRKGDRARAARVYDRMDDLGIASILPLMRPSERRAAAEVALDDSRVERTLKMPLPALVALFDAAPEDRATSALAQLPRRHATRVLGGLREPRRRRLTAALVDARRAQRGRADLTSVLRLRRLFGAPRH